MPRSRSSSPSSNVQSSVIVNTVVKTHGTTPSTNVNVYIRTTSQVDANTSKVYEDIATEVNNKFREHGYFDPCYKDDRHGRPSILSLKTQHRENQTLFSARPPSNMTKMDKATLEATLDVERESIQCMAELDINSVVQSSIQEIVGRSIKDTKISKPEIIPERSTPEFIDMRSADKEAGLAILTMKNK